jgi:peptide/nickel transport system permease protein
MIPTLFGVSVVVWAIVTGAPEPPIAQQVPTSAEAGAGAAGGVPQAVKVFRAQYGLDQPKILNLYYDLDKGEVRRTLENATDVEGTRSIKDKARASEQLIKWGQYAVPALLGIAGETDGRLRDEAMAWLVKSAQRVPVGDIGGEIRPARARENSEIVRENEILGLCRWTPDASPARRAAGIAAVRMWYEGARGAYAGGADAAEVGRAVDANDGAALERLGASAVPALVDLVLGGDVTRRDRAIAWFVRLARVPEEGDDAQRERARLRNRTLGKLGWSESDPETAKDGAADVVRTWWQGATARWDHSGLKKLKVLFLETQFATYWRNLLRFDLGQSMTHKVPVMTLVMERIKYSLTLALSSLILAYLIAVPAGILSAKIHGSLGERALGFVFFALYSLPSFYVATLMIKHLAQDQPGSLQIIPAARFEDLNAWRLPSWQWLKDIGWHVVGPIACMTYGTFAALSRYAKTGILHVIRSDYVRTARAKGLGEFIVTVKHAARNGIIPLVTLLGTTLPVIVSGNFIIEVIFSIPGFGQLTLQAIYERDYSVIIGVDLVIAVLTMLGILLSDLLYAVVDPRISYS